MRSPVDATITTVHGRPVDLSKLRAISPSRGTPAITAITADVLRAIRPDDASSPVSAAMQSVQATLQRTPSARVLSVPVPLLPPHVAMAAEMMESGKVATPKVTGYSLGPDAFSPQSHKRRRVDAEEEAPAPKIIYLPPPTTVVHGFRNKVRGHVPPDYYTMDEEERTIHMTMLIKYMAKLRTVYGADMDIPKIQFSTNPAYMRKVYIFYTEIVDQTEANSNLQLYRFFVSVYLSMLELVVTKAFGYTEHATLAHKIYNSRYITWYEEALHELCETGSFSFTKSWHPVLKILVYGLVQTMAVVIIMLLYKLIGANAAVIESLFLNLIGSRDEPIQNNKAPQAGPAPRQAAAGTPRTSATDLPPPTDPAAGTTLGGFDLSNLNIGNIVTQITGAIGGLGASTTPAVPPASSQTPRGPRHRR